MSSKADEGKTQLLQQEEASREVKENQVPKNRKEKNTERMERTM